MVGFVVVFLNIDDGIEKSSKVFFVVFVEVVY